MKILITGYKGFIGQNLCLELRNRGYADLLLFDQGQSSKELEEYLKESDCVFHLAGVNRPKDPKEFSQGNVDLTAHITEMLAQLGKSIPIIHTSSVQASLDNPYGKSKKEGEEILLSYGEKMQAPVYVFRLPNVFGKWSRPNYNSVVSTFCHNIARGMDIEIHDESKTIELVHIDDVVNALIECLHGKIVPHEDGRGYVEEVYPIQVGELARRIESFKDEIHSLQVPNQKDLLSKKLYATYLSYLPEDEFGYPLVTHEDHRGAFTEVLKQGEFGQVSINVIRPGITKGNHWHHTKNEKFLVVKGRGVVRFRDIREEKEKIITYKVSDHKMEVIQIPPGYTHNITNGGEEDMIVLMWTSEAYNPDKPDTYFAEV